MKEKYTRIYMYMRNTYIFTRIYAHVFSLTYISLSYIHIYSYIFSLIYIRGSYNTYIFCRIFRVFEGIAGKMRVNISRNLR